MSHRSSDSRNTISSRNSSSLEIVRLNVDDRSLDHDDGDEGSDGDDNNSGSPPKSKDEMIGLDSQLAVPPMLSPDLVSNTLRAEVHRGQSHSEQAPIVLRDALEKEGDSTSHYSSDEVDSQTSKNEDRSILDDDEIFDAEVPFELVTRKTWMGYYAFTEVEARYLLSRHVDKRDIVVLGLSACIGFSALIPTVLNHWTLYYHIAIAVVMGVGAAVGYALHIYYKLPDQQAEPKQLAGVRRYELLGQLLLFVVHSSSIIGAPTSNHCSEEIQNRGKVGEGLANERCINVLFPYLPLNMVVSLLFVELRTVHSLPGLLLAPVFFVSIALSEDPGLYRSDIVIANAFFFAAIMLAFGAAFFAVDRTRRTQFESWVRVERGKRTFQTEQRKTDEYLRSLLPRGVVKKLVLGETAFEGSTNVSVVVTQLQNGARWGTEVLPELFVVVLDSLFCTLDRLLDDRVYLIKAKTVGDKHVVNTAAGNGRVELTPASCCDAGVEYASVASTVASRLSSRLAKRFLGAQVPNIEFQFGADYGICFGGVIGVHTLQYETFGEALQNAMDLANAATSMHIRASNRIVEFSTFPVKERALVSAAKNNRANKRLHHSVPTRTETPNNNNSSQQQGMSFAVLAATSDAPPSLFEVCLPPPSSSPSGTSTPPTEEPKWVEFLPSRMFSLPTGANGKPMLRTQAVGATVSSGSLSDLAGRSGEGESTLTLTTFAVGLQRQRMLKARQVKNGDTHSDRFHRNQYGSGGGGDDDGGMTAMMAPLPSVGVSVPLGSDDSDVDEEETVPNNRFDNSLETEEMSSPTTQGTTAALLTDVHAGQGVDVNAFRKLLDPAVRERYEQAFTTARTYHATYHSNICLIFHVAFICLLLLIQSMIGKVGYGSAVILVLCIPATLLWIREKCKFRVRTERNYRYFDPLSSSKTPAASPPASSVGLQHEGNPLEEREPSDLIAVLSGAEHQQKKKEMLKHEEAGRALDVHFATSTPASNEWVDLLVMIILFTLPVIAVHLAPRSLVNNDNRFSLTSIGVIASFATERAQLLTAIGVQIYLCLLHILVTSLSPHTFLTADYLLVVFLYLALLGFVTFKAQRSRNQYCHLLAVAWMVASENAEKIQIQEDLLKMVIPERFVLPVIEKSRGNVVCVFDTGEVALCFLRFDGFANSLTSKLLDTGFDAVYDDVMRLHKVVDDELKASDGLLERVSSLGDEVLLGGPLANRDAEKAAGNLRRQAQETLVDAAVKRATAVAANIVTTWQSECSVVLHVSDASVAIMGSRRPTISVVGPATRVGQLLLNTIPIGQKIVTETFYHQHMDRKMGGPSESLFEMEELTSYASQDHTGNGGGGGTSRVREFNKSGGGSYHAGPSMTTTTSSGQTLDVQFSEPERYRVRSAGLLYVRTLLINPHR